MTEQEQQRAIRLYFTSFPKWSLGLIVVGVFCLGAGQAGVILLGLLFVGVGGAALVVRRGMISDAEYDRLRKEALKKASEKALEKWRVDLGDLMADPIRVFGPAFGFKTSTWAFKKGHDGIIRFNPVRFAVIGFGEQQLLAYAGVIDMITGKIRNEEVDECYYRHVVSASTRTESIEYTHRGELVQLDDTETFVLMMSSGNSVRVPIRSRRLATLLGEEDMQAKEASDAVAAVSKMLQDTTRRMPI